MVGVRTCKRVSLTIVLFRFSVSSIKVYFNWNRLVLDSTLLSNALSWILVKLSYLLCWHRVPRDTNLKRQLVALTTIMHLSTQWHAQAPHTPTTHMIHNCAIMWTLYINKSTTVLQWTVWVRCCSPVLIRSWSWFSHSLCADVLSLSCHMYVFLEAFC